MLVYVYVQDATNFIFFRPNFALYYNIHWRRIINLGSRRVSVRHQRKSNVFRILDDGVKNKNIQFLIV